MPRGARPAYAGREAQRRRGVNSILMPLYQVFLALSTGNDTSSAHDLENLYRPNSTSGRSLARLPSIGSLSLIHWRAAKLSATSGVSWGRRSMALATTTSTIPVVGITAPYATMFNS